MPLSGNVFSLNTHKYGSASFSRALSLHQCKGVTGRNECPRKSDFLSAVNHSPAKDASSVSSRRGHYARGRVAHHFTIDPLIQRSGGAARQERFTVVLGVLPSEDEPNRPCSSLFPPSCPGSHLRPFPSSWPTHRQIWSASFHEPKGFSPSSMTNVIPDSKRR